MALAPEDVDKFIAIATEENLEATPVAKVTEEKRLNMVWNGVSIVNISREFLNSNGAEKHQNVHVEKGSVWQPPVSYTHLDVYKRQGVGMVLTVPAEQADKALEILHANGEPEAYRLGVIAEGEGVELC